jgi:hypothetical protein
MALPLIRENHVNKRAGALIFSFYLYGKAKPWLPCDLPSRRCASSKEGEPLAENGNFFYFHYHNRKVCFLIQLFLYIAF